MLKKNYFFIFLFLSITSYCQDYDTNYVQPYKHKLNIRTLLFTKSASFSIKSTSNIDSLNSKTVKYIPNVASLFGLGLSYKYFSMIFAFKLPISDAQLNKYGKTTYSDMQINIYKRKYLFSGYIRNYKGFYINKPKEIYPDLADTLPNPSRRDLNYYSMGMECYYFFNNSKYSLKSSFSNVERQLKSASSFLLKGDMSYSYIEGDSCIIPYTQNDKFGNLKGLNYFGFASIGITAGYTYNFVIKRNFYINPFLFTGIGVQIKEFNADLGKSSSIAGYGNSGLRISAGYNGNRYYLGLILDLAGSSQNQEQIKFETSTFLLALKAGFRFF